MLRAFLPTGQASALPAGAESAEALRAACWIDLLEPTPDETRLVERTLGIELPTRKEAQEIEVSSRLYVENGTAFMTATVPVRTDSAHPQTTPVTFAYQRQKLVTSRFATPAPFETFAAKLERAPAAYPSAQRVLMGLVDELIDRLADILEGVGRRPRRGLLDRLSGRRARGRASRHRLHRPLDAYRSNGERAAHVRREPGEPRPGRHVLRRVAAGDRR